MIRDVVFLGSLSFSAFRGAIDLQKELFVFVPSAVRCIMLNSGQVRPVGRLLDT